MSRILMICVLFVFGCNLSDDTPLVGPPSNNTYPTDMAEDGTHDTDLPDMVEPRQDMDMSTACASCEVAQVCFNDACCSPLLPQACSAEQCGMVDDGCGQMVDCGVCPSQAVAVYVTRNATGTGNVLQFDVTSDGRLSPMGTPDLTTGTGNAVEIVISPDTKHAYVGAGGNGSRPVHAFDIDPDTNELSLNPYPQLEGSSGLQRRDSLAMDPQGRFVYMADQGPDRRSTFTFEIIKERLTGSLNQVAENRDYNTPRKVVVEPQGRFVYLLDGSLAINILPVNNDGSLARFENYPLRFNPREMAVDPMGEFLYVIGTTNELGVYRINQATGALTFVAAPDNANFFETANSPQKIVVDALGRYVWVVAENNVYGHTIRRDLGGVLEKLDQDANPNDFTGFPVSSLRNLASGPNGKFVFAVGAGSTHTLTVSSEGKLSEDVAAARGGGDNIAVLGRVP